MLFSVVPVPVPVPVHVHVHVHVPCCVRCAVCAVQEEAVLETRPVVIDESDPELVQLRRALAERSEELLSGEAQQAEPPVGHEDTGGGYDGRFGAYGGGGAAAAAAGDKAAARNAAATAVSEREAELEAADRRAAQIEKDVRVVEDVRKVAALKKT